MDGSATPSATAASARPAAAASVASSAMSTTPSGGVLPAASQTLRPSRSITTIVARPLSMLSTRSLHKREPGEPSSSPATLLPPSGTDDGPNGYGHGSSGSPRASFSSTRGSKRDSRGLLAAQVELNFEEALLRDDTLRLSSSPSGDNRSSLDSAKGKGTADSEDEELLADISGSADSTILEQLDIDRTAEGGSVSGAGTVDGSVQEAFSPGSTAQQGASTPPYAASRPIEGKSSPETSARAGWRDKPPPSSFSAPTATSAPSAGQSASSHVRQPSPRPSLTLREEDSVTATPPAKSAQPGIIPPSPSIIPPTPTQPPTKSDRRPSGSPTPDGVESRGAGEKRKATNEIPRTRTSLDLATLALQPDNSAPPASSPPLSSRDNSSAKSTPRAPTVSTFISPSSPNDVLPQTPLKPLQIISSLPSQLVATKTPMARSPSGGLESDLSTDDWEKLGLSPSTPNKSLNAKSGSGSGAEPSAVSERGGGLPSPSRQISYGIGAGIGSTPSAASPESAHHRGDGFRSMKFRARNAFSKFFSSPARGAHADVGSGAGAEGMPRKGSPRHFGSMSSSNLAAYAGIGSPARKESNTSVLDGQSGSKGLKGINGVNSATLPSRSSSHNSLTAAQASPPLPPLPNSSPRSSPQRKAPSLDVALGKTPSPKPAPLASLSPERRLTEPITRPDASRTTAALEQAQSTSPTTRRRSMSVSDVKAAGDRASRSWDHEVEGLLDGIIDGGGERKLGSPLRAKRIPRNALSTASSPRQPASSARADPGWSTTAGPKSLFASADSRDGTLVTTITADKGRTSRPIVGAEQRLVSPPLEQQRSDGTRASMSSVRSLSDLRGERRPSGVSMTSSFGMPRVDEYDSSAGRSPRSLEEPISLAESVTRSGSSLSLDKSAGMRTLPAIPASPSGQSFGLSGSPYTIPSPVAHTAALSSSRVDPGAAMPTVDLTSDADGDDTHGSGGGGSSPRFREQTIRLVPASPSPRLPPLPNTSPMATPSTFILRRHASDDGLRPATPTKMAGRPLIETLESVGLGIVNPTTAAATSAAAVAEGEELVLGSEIKLQTPEEEAEELVQRIRDEDETLKWVSQNRVAEFLGGRNRVNRLACKLYLTHFDFAGQKLDAAIRTLTSELYFRAETQELDRIIEAFSERYFECNPSAVYGSPSVIHQVVYGLLLLNTDLHVADHDRRMTRAQFVDNVMSSIRTELDAEQQTRLRQQSATEDAAATPPVDDAVVSSKRDSDVFYDAASSAAVDSVSSLQGSNASLALPRESQDVAASPASLSRNLSTPGTTVPNSPAPSVNAGHFMAHTPNGSALGDLRHAILRKDSFTGMSMPRGWFIDMEASLKDLYASVKSQQILQPMDNADDAAQERRPSMSLSPSSHSSVSRARSLRSASSTSAVNKRASIRGFGAFGASLASIGTSTAPSLYGGRLSPTPTYATSMHEGFDRDEPAQSAPGFASNLKHTVIKETDGESISSGMSSSTVDDMLDEELALLGAPWAKEGMISRKIYLDADGRRAKDKNWRNLFTVVGTGNIQMYTFESSSSSTNKSTVGGGNWLSNAHLVDEFPLAHCVAKVLPPPGYNRSRPHVFTVDQPNGAQSFFQVGTDSLADEWTSTCNYRAARTSKEPLTGGVSNMEYGWGKHTLAETSDGGSVMSSRKRMFSAAPTIMEWKLPQQPLYPSQLDEETQLEHLRKYAVKLRAEMEEHISVEKYLIPIRQPSGMRAHDNYRRKLKFLQEEQFKYQTYIAALEDGLRLRMSKRGEIKLNKTLEKAGRRLASRDD